MLHQDEPQTRIRRKRPEELNERFQTAGRGPDAHD